MLIWNLWMQKSLLPNFFLFLFCLSWKLFTSFPISIFQALHSLMISISYANRRREMSLKLMQMPERLGMSIKAFKLWEFFLSRKLKSLLKVQRSLKVLWSLKAFIKSFPSKTFRVQSIRLNFVIGKSNTNQDGRKVKQRYKGHIMFMICNLRPTENAKTISISSVMTHETNLLELNFLSLSIIFMFQLPLKRMFTKPTQLLSSTGHSNSHGLEINAH